MPPIDLGIGDKIGDWLEGGLTDLVHTLLQFLWELLLQAIRGILTGERINLLQNATWNDNYQLMLAIGVSLSFTFGLFGALYHVLLGHIGTMWRFLVYWVQVSLVGALFPVMFSYLYDLSIGLRGAMTFGITSDALEQVDVISGTGLWDAGIYAFILFFVAIFLFIEMLFLDLLAWVVLIGAGFAYGLRPVWKVGDWLWKRVLSCCIACLLGGPVAVGLISTSIFYVGQVQIQPVPGQVISPQFMLLLLFFIVAMLVPVGMFYAIDKTVETNVKSGKLQSSGKGRTQTTIKKSSGGQSLGARTVDHGVEHVLDLRTARKTAELSTRKERSGSSRKTQIKRNVANALVPGSGELVGSGKKGGKK